MFGKEKIEYPPLDISRKAVKNRNGVKIVPTTKAEQKKLKKDIKKHQLDWIDRIEEFDAFMG